MDTDIHNLTLMDMNINIQNMVMEGELIIDDGINRTPDIMKHYLSIFY